MANGRLGSATIDPNRTAQVYNNTSGNEASVSIIANSISSTTNGVISLSVDSAAVTPETITNIDSTTRTYNTTPLVFFNTAYTAVEGSMQFVSATANHGDQLGNALTFTDGATSTNVNNNFMPAAFLVPDDTSGGYALSRGVGQRGGSNYYRLTEATYKADYPLSWLRQSRANDIQSQTAVSGLSYSNYGSTVDPYTIGFPNFNVHSNKYMSSAHINTSNGIAAQSATSLSVFTQYIGNPCESGLYKRPLMARGGVLGFGADNTSVPTFLRFYAGRTEEQHLGERVMDSYFGNTNNNPAVYVTSDSYQTSAESSSLVFVDYNPHTKMGYYLGWIHGAYRLMEWTYASAEKFVSDQAGGNQTITIANYAQLATNWTWATELTVPSEWDVTNVQWKCTQSFRVADKLWVLNEGSTKNPTSNTTWTSPDLKTWNKQSSTSYFDQVIDSTVPSYVRSSASGTNKVASNYNTVNTAGTLEVETSMSQLERTGLVLSSGDRVYAVNKGTTPVSVQVMGYEG
tara:strand:- start:927 stop:2471 length:1545 start_codon:yes stop_codon:yes gene_type:complete